MLLHGKPTTEQWLGSLEKRTALSEREGARKAAAAFLQCLETPSGWADQASSAHFIDDDYTGSQIYLEIWETLGPHNLAAARELVKEMTSLDAVLEPGEPT
jgi:hypothetical protein